MSTHCLINHAVCEQYRNADDPLLSFVHAQRTGGSALRAGVFEKLYGVEGTYATRNVADYKHWPQLQGDDTKGYKVFAGHSNYREISLNRPFFFISLVRSPYLRAVSLYHYCRRREDNFLHQMAMESTIEEFHRKGAEHTPGYFINVQCKRICEYDDAARALDTIDKRFVGIGVTEYLSEFVEEIGPLLGWEGARIDRAQNLASRSQDEISDELRKIVHEHDKEDLKLYRAVMDRIGLSE